MFLQYILKRKNYDLLLKFFNAQNPEPSKNDWTVTVKKDLAELGLEDSFDQIKQFSKLIWLKRVKKACKKLAFENLLETQMEYSKGSNLGYGSLKIRSYLKSTEINSNQAKIIFKIRTRMIQVYNNFKNGFDDVKCPICKEGEDSQEHVFVECKKLGERITRKQYFVFFSENEEEIAKIVTKVEKTLILHKEFIEGLS